MSDDPPLTAADPDHVVHSEAAVWARETAPQSPYTMREAGIGFLGLVIGSAIAFGIPLLLT